MVQSARASVPEPQDTWSPDDLPDGLPRAKPDRRRSKKKQAFLNGQSSGEAEITKQVSIFLPLDDWKLIRAEAARRKITMTELGRQYLEKGGLKILREDAA